MSSQPRVLFVMGSNGTGGTELQARALIRGLRERGLHVTVVLLDGEHGQEGLPSDTQIIASHRPRSVGALLTYLLAMRQIRRRLRSGEFDVIHGVHARGYVISAVSAAGVKNVRRVAWRRNLGIHLTGPRRVVMSALEKIALRLTDVVLVNSADVREYWVTRHGLSPANVLIVPNLLEDWRFDVERRPRAERPVILAVGGLRPVKGHHLLLRAVSQLSCAREVQVVILGEGECRSTLEKLAEELQVALALPGVHADPRPWLARAAIYAHPSLSEGSSNAVLEAMAAGVPIVASDVGGMRELVGDTAVLVPPGDVESLQKKIAQLLNAPSEGGRLGAAARERAARLFSKEAVIRTTTQVYRGEFPCAAS